MSQRIVYNSFVAGEISPELWGRHDVEMYHHAVARLSNFVPRRTGGIRKRAGTELMWHLASETGREYRIIPYYFEKDQFGLLALWRVSGSQKVNAAFRAFRNDGTVDTVMPENDNGIGVFEIGTSEKLEDLKYIQIGDTLFFTFHGRAAFKCAVTFSGPTLEWTQVQPSTQPADAPSMSAKAHNFESGDNYKGSTRTYRLWGVRDGILSKASEKTVSITLAWVAGAYVEIKFTPDWAHHDYYILAKLQGGQYGEVTRYYPGLDTGERTDTTWTLTSKQSETVDGINYYAASANPGSTWSAENSGEDKTNGNGLHVNGTWVCKAQGVHNPKSAPILSVLLWTGAIMGEGSASGTATKIGLAEQVTAKLWKGEQGTGTMIEEWTFAPQYGESARKLTVSYPQNGPSNGLYTISFSADGEDIYIPLRGCILCSDTGTRTFIDDNIQPGTLAGEQDKLDVGDTGMDVDCITTWQQRLIAAGSANLPFTLWFSAVGDLYNFYTYRPQNSDDAFEATMAVTMATRIRHIIAEKWLLVFTDTGEFMVDSNSGALAFNTVDIRKISGVGAHGGIPPVATESEVLFVASDGRSVYKMDYTLERDSVVPTNLSVRASHVAEGGIAAIAYQRYPDSILWCLLEDGSLASMTYFPDEQVCAWAKHELGGGGGLKAVDIFSTGTIRAEEDTASTSDTFLVLTHQGKPGDVWIERLRPNVIVDEPSAEAALCADHMGYEQADWPGESSPQANVEASMETLRIEPQQADTVGISTAQFGAILRILRSGEVAVRPVVEDGPAADWRGTGTQPASLPEESSGTVGLVRKDVRIATQVVWNRSGRIEIKSADEWPCDILSMGVLATFGTMRNGG